MGGVPACVVEKHGPSTRAELHRASHPACRLPAYQVQYHCCIPILVLVAAQPLPCTALRRALRYTHTGAGGCPAIAMHCVAYRCWGPLSHCHALQICNVELHSTDSMIHYPRSCWLRY